MSDAQPAPYADDQYGRRKMDEANAHIAERLERIERSADRLDHLLRGNGVPGLVAQVAVLDRATIEHAAQLETVARVPAELRALAAIVEAERKARLETLAADRQARKASDEKLDAIATRLERKDAVKEGEKAAVDRAARWLKITAGALAILGIGGSFGLAQMVQNLQELVAAVGALP